MLMFPNHSNHAQTLFVEAGLFISCAKELFKIKLFGILARSFLNLDHFNSLKKNYRVSLWV